MLNTILITAVNESDKPEQTARSIQMLQEMFQNPLDNMAVVLPIIIVCFFWLGLGAIFLRWTVRLAKLFTS